MRLTRIVKGMRALLVAAMFLPLAGCFGTPGLEATLFAYQPIAVSSPEPIVVGDCSELLESLNERALRQAKVSLHQDYDRGVRPWWGWGDVAVEESADASGSDGGGGAPTRRAEVTGTNNQEAAVDEADLLKTDGRWTYVLDGNQLHILHSSDVGNLTGFAKVAVGQGWGSQLLLDTGDPDDESDDRLVVISRGGSDGSAAGDDMWWGSRGSTEILVLDLANRSNPDVVAQHIIEGDNVGARMVDGIAYIVVHAWEEHLGMRTWIEPTDQELKDRGMTWQDYWDQNERDRNKMRLEIAQAALEENERVAAALTLEDHLPSQQVLVDGQLQTVPYTQERCRSVLSAMDDTGRGTNTILALDPVSGAFADAQILSGYPIVYGATDALVLASASQEVWWMWAQPDLDESTNLHWFDLDGLNVSHRASGRVDGYVQDQFGLDVSEDTLRVVTTTGRWGRWWLAEPEPMANHLVVFGEEANVLVEQGRVGGIAPGERLWSARFTDDRAYLVTFEQIDPLWVIDLADPSNPTILGELEIPGVSTYIHPLGDDALLTIGLGPGPRGQGLDWSALQVSLFDIRDPTDPQLADVMRIAPPGGQGWSWSAALHEHKAFTYWDKLGMLAVPVASTSYERYWVSDCGDGNGCWRNDQRHFVGLRLVDVDVPGMNLTLHGTVNQDALMRDGITYPRYYGLDIQRSYFLGFPDTYPVDPVSVYAMSGLGMTAHDLETLEEQAAVNFTDEYDPDALAMVLQGAVGQG